MTTFKGIFDGKNVIIKDKVPFSEKQDVLVTFLDESNEDETELIRSFGSSSNAFKFWEDEKEDIYQDYLKEK